MTDTPATPQPAHTPEAATVAAEASKKWTQIVKDRASRGYGEMKQAVTFAEGKSWKGFARVGTVGVGAVVAAGALKSKDAEGNDRSALSRLGNVVIGGGMVAGGLLAGGR